MAEPAFAGVRIATTERTRTGEYVVRIMIAPAAGWKQASMHWRFNNRAAALAFASTLAVDHETAVLNDHATAIAPAWGEF